MRRRPLLGALALLIAVAGCGEREERVRPAEAEPFRVVLESSPHADHAPIYAARSARHFRDAGLGLRVRTSAAPIDQVARGRADLAVAGAPDVLRARERGLAVVAVGALVQKPLSAIVSLPAARVGDVRDLRGKRVGTVGKGSHPALLRAILAEAGLPPRAARARDVGREPVPALLSGRVEALFGVRWNYDGVLLRLRGRRPRVIRLEEAGVPSHDELVLVAGSDVLERDGGGVRAFMAALALGEREVRRDPGSAVRALLAENRALDARLERESVRVTTPLFAPPRRRPYGWQDPREWSRLRAWMTDNGLLRPGVDPREAFTNDHLPGRGLDD
ncbi:MAG: ABC transporter substrate-binding protein [Thermoleophilaceae bacterium]